MGTDAHIVVVGATPEHARRAINRVADLERRWSRFRPDSEISQLNRNAGRPTIVSNETFTLIRTAVDAWSATNGLFDPTVLRAMESNGYNTSFELIDRSQQIPTNGSRSPGCADIELHSGTRMVRLPAGVGIDAGGIGKGLAAELVAQELITTGAIGALVNLGGDVQVVGQPPTDDGWVIEIEDPLDPTRSITRIALGEGGVATSSTRRRRWTHANNTMHHIVDPTTGQPTTGTLIGVTVVAPTASWAEALTKAVLVAGDLTPIHHTTASAIAVRRDGTCLASPQLQELCP